MKALDIYLAFCFFMVFGALLEYATVSYTGKRIKLKARLWEEMQEKLETELKCLRCTEGGEDWPRLPIDAPAPPCRLFGMRASDIERWARLLFPLTFLGPAWNCSLSRTICSVR